MAPRWVVPVGMVLGLAALAVVSGVQSDGLSLLLDNTTTAASVNASSMSYHAASAKPQLTGFAALKANAVELFTKKMRPGQPEWNMLVPMLIAYWSIAVFYDILDSLPFRWIRRYRIERREPGGRGNQMSKRDVIIRVIIQHSLQTLLGMGLMVVDTDMCKAHRVEPLPQRAVRFVLGMFIMDSYQYWVHRVMHDVKFLYRHMHSKHHSLTVPYAYGALYNTILEGFILDSMGGAITHYASGLDCNTASVLMTFATCKTVMDHCGYRFPVNPIHNLFPNSASFHDIHHDWRWGQSNLSQPFFTHWDWLFGTFVDPKLKHMTPEEVDKKDDAEEVKKLK